MTIYLTHEPEKKVVLGPECVKVTIPKRPYPGLIQAAAFTEERLLKGGPPVVMTLRDLPPVPEEEKGRVYSEEEVGWVFSPEPAYVRLTGTQRLLLRKLIKLVPLEEMPEGTTADDIKALLEEIDFPLRFTQ